MVACGSVGKTCGISCFSDTESSYKSIKKGEFAIKEASGRVCLDASCALICQSGRVCTISWKWWDVIEMACGIVKQVRGGGVLSVECQPYKRVCHWLHLSPSGEQSDMKQLREKGGKISLRGLEQLTVFIIPASCTPPATASVFGTSLWGWCYLTVRRYAILASLEGFDAWCETK